MSGMVLVGLRECADMYWGMKNHRSAMSIMLVGTEQLLLFGAWAHILRTDWMGQSHVWKQCSSATSSLIYLTEYPHPPHNPTATQPEAPPTIGHHGVTVIGTGNNDNEVGAGLAERHTY